MFGRSQRAQRTEPVYVEETYVEPAHTTRARRSNKPSLMTRLRGRKAHKTHHTTTTTTAAPRRTGGRFSRRNKVTVEPVHHQQRKPSLGDKVSGAILKLKGSIEHKPGKKAAGTRRMHGTDGRGERRRYY